MNNSDLITQVKMRAALPSSQITFTDTEILSIAQDCLQSEIVPDIIAVREEFYVTSTSEPVVADKAHYAVSSRAVGNTIRELKLIYDSEVRDLPRMEVEEIKSLQSGEPNRFYFEGSYLKLYPIPQTTRGTLKQYFFFRPGDLVDSNRKALITGIADTTLTLSAGTVSPGSLVTIDVLKSTAPFETLSFDVTVLGVAGSDVTVSAVDSRISVGDVVMPAGEAHAPQMPQECYSWLCQLTAARCLEILGQVDQAQYAQAQADRLKTAALRLIATRAQGAPKKFRSHL